LVFPAITDLKTVDRHRQADEAPVEQLALSHTLTGTDTGKLGPGREREFESMFKSMSGPRERERDTGTKAGGGQCLGVWGQFRGRDRSRRQCWDRYIGGRGKRLHRGNLSIFSLLSRTPNVLLPIGQVERQASTHSPCNLSAHMSKVSPPSDREGSPCENRESD
jgi:hypothetical protein